MRITTNSISRIPFNRSITTNHWRNRHQFFRSSSVTSSDYSPLPAIGLELHVQLASTTKLFSLANSPSSTPEHNSNSNVALFDAATPGTQPILSPDCLRLAIIAALALDCKVNQKTSFDRKHYFYPDLPAGYQITQHYSPIAKEGKLLITPEDGADRTFEARITQLQLEQDTAKSFTDPLSPDQILIDLNRSGAALIEIVTGPDFRTAKEASIFVRKLQSILRFAGVTKGNMEQGSLRCDLNVSISLPESTIQGQRCEVKNVNGFGHIERAIDFEISRQKALVAAGTKIRTETRGFDVSQRKTFKLREKETDNDYRYLPDYDIPPILIPSPILERLKCLVPELPHQIIQRLEKSYHINKITAEILIMIGFDRIDQLVDVGCGVRYFEAAMKNTEVKGQIMANWIVHELLGVLAKAELRFIECPICPEEFSQLVESVSKCLLPRPKAREMLSLSIKTPKISINEQIKKIFNEKNLISYKTNSILTEDFLVKKISNEIISDMKFEVNLIKNGNTKIISKLIGIGMKRSQHKVNPQLLRKALEELIKSDT